MPFPKLRFSAGLFAAFLFSCHSKQPADLIVHHARVYMVDSAFSEAEAFAVREGKILAIGKEEDILGRYTGPMEDAGGEPVYPGFIDAHAHFVRYGESLFT